MYIYIRSKNITYIVNMFKFELNCELIGIIKLGNL